MPHLSRLLVALAIAAQIQGCANRPYVFSPALDVIPKSADARNLEPLAGDLHLSLFALEAQRRAWWDAAGQTEAMKATSAVGLVGLGAISIYKVMQGDATSTFLRRSATATGAGYAISNWFEPDATQRVYLAGAMALTCLALQSSPYQMRSSELHRLQDLAVTARQDEQRLHTALQLRRAELGAQAERDSWIEQGSRKARFAARTLNRADRAMGTIERVGPRLRDMTALTSSEVARQMERVVKDLSDLPAAIKSIQGQSNLLLGESPPADSLAQDSVAPGVSSAAEVLDASITARAAASTCKVHASTRPVPRTGHSQAAPRGATMIARAKQATPAMPAVAPIAQTAHTMSGANGSAVTIERAMGNLDHSIGPIYSFVQRYAAASERERLPESCGYSNPVRIIPAVDSIVLQPGESFQFLLEGDDGVPTARWLQAQAPAGMLDLSMPVAASPSKGSHVLRVAAGKAIDAPLKALLHLSDSRGVREFNVDVTVCPVSANQE